MEMLAFYAISIKATKSKGLRKKREMTIFKPQYLYLNI